ncbi:hypothetical protein BT93_D0784 [Corymbia citriodora subsp. variegata]|nr:hypothetical protein BT93_D0784 [Corymbia citriodora subsp. variegata]
MTLQDAIAADDVNQLYRLIEGDINLLDHESEGPFPDTPLHDAAGNGKTKVAMEIAILKSSFPRKLNRGGYSPIHLALQNKHYDTVRALMTLNPELVRVHGRGGITPLHFVAGTIVDNEQDNVKLLELLAEFLSTCNSSIKDLTNQCETAVQIAVRAGNIEAFKVLFGWLKLVHLTKILDWKDQDGDTALHIATSERQPEIIKLLVKYADVNAKNFESKTALEIFKESPSGSPDVAKRFHDEGHQARHYTPTLSLSQYFGREQKHSEKWARFFNVQDKSNRDMIIVVSILIATATYQAALTPPGGYWQDSSSNSTFVTANSSSIAIGKPHEAGGIILSGKRLIVYSIYNSVAFLASIATFLAAALRLERSTFMVCFNVELFCFAFLISITTQIPETDMAAQDALMLLLWFSLPAILSFPIYAMYKTLKLASVRRRVDATWRHLENFPGSEDGK